jgi:hypothetical protein
MNIFKEKELDIDSVVKEFLTTANEAKFKAESEYYKYRIIQDEPFESDFDKFIKIIKK